MERYADIVLPLAQPAYTYAVADGLDVEEGQAVAVQFGARRIYTGIVWRIHGRRPDFPRIKTVSRVLYDRPLLDARQRALWEWMADYYLCTLGEVMRFALPQTIKPSGNSEQEFADREYRPRTELYAALDASLHDEERFHDLMERLSRRAPRQYAALLAIASAEGGDRISTGEVPRRLLEADAATLAALQKKGLVTLTRRERSVERGSVRFQLPTLTPAQQSCLDTIRGHFDAGRRTVLLHGITGSGKTELYIHLIAEALARGVGGIAAASSTFAVNGYGAVFLKKLLDVCAKLIVQYIDIDAARYMAFGIFGYRAYINQLDGLVLYHFLKLVGG